MKVLSLFDGISCGRIALERSNINVERYVAYEIEENAIKITKKNYPDTEEMGDVFKGDFTQYKDFDLLIGGSPCTYWSIAQKAEDREVTNSGLGWELFSQYTRALKESNIPYFIYENNYSMDKKIKEEITKAFKEILGYEIKPIHINSALVSAQKRDRLYWTNIPCNGDNFMPEDKNIKLQDILEFGYADKPKSLCIARRYAGFQGTESYLCRRYFGKSFGQAAFSTKEDRDTLYNLYKENPYFDKDTPVEKDPTKRKIRQLTVTEVERLQTLPDNYTQCDNINDSKRIETIGNGWTVDVITYILNGFQRQKNAAI
jgi:DNA-cytosine methyltransferase